MKLNIFIVSCLAALTMLVCSACKKNMGPDLHLAIPSPSNLVVDSLKPEKATVHWQYSDKRVQSFTIEVSANEAFSSIVRSYTVKDTTRKVNVDSLGSLTKYYVRVRALSDDILYYSGYGTTNFVSEEIENIFLSITKSDLTLTSVVLKWTSPKKGTVSKLIITPVGGTALAPITLSATDVAAGKITVTGLSSATAYRADIYAGDERKGIAYFSTIDPNSVITINSKPETYDELQAAVNAAQSGDVINVGGAKYSFSTGVDITNKSLTIKAVAGGSQPEITTGGFTLTGSVANLTISGIKFNINAGSYFINASTVVGASSISLEDLDVSGPTAGLVYVSATGTSAAVSFSVNNCLMHDFGATGGDFIDFRAGVLNYLKVTNSTFYKVARDFFRIDATVSYPATNQPILVENCTFNNVCGIDNTQGRFLYVRVAKITGYTMMKINKCIMSNKFRSQAGGVNPTIESSNCNVSGSSSAEWLAYTTQTNITSLDPQYTDAASGKFNVGNATIKAAGWGDPRWLK